MNAFWFAVMGAAAAALAARALPALAGRAAAVRRIALLGDAAIAEPDAPAAATLLRVCDFFGAEDCIVAFAAPQCAPEAFAARGDAAPLAARIMALPNAVVGCRRRLFGRRARPRVALASPVDGAAALDAARSFDAAVACACWVGVPFDVPGAASGRLCLLGPRRRPALADIALLGRVGALVAARRRQRQRTEALLREAAQRERSHIGLDLHDSTIQPYLGLKLGLEALAHRMRPGDPLAADVDDLVRMTRESIDELRGYVRGLDSRAHGGGLREGVAQQAERFGRLYGIEVATEVRGDVDIAAPLADEIMHMIGESLANVGRHTVSRQARVAVAARAGELRAEVVDEGSGGAWHRFEPLSLQRRAGLLGGSVAVAPRGSGSVVTMTIPLAPHS